jgi:hypothetical protein
MSLLTTETRTISGKEYTIKVLPSGPARKALARVQKMITVSADAAGEMGLSLTLLAATVGQLPEEDLEFLIGVFAPTTHVNMGDSREAAPLGNPKIQDELWCGGLEDMYAWLDACIEVNFKGILEKLRGALKAVHAAMDAPKAQPTT